MYVIYAPEVDGPTWTLEKEYLYCIAKNLQEVLTSRCLFFALNYKRKEKYLAK